MSPIAACKSVWLKGCMEDCDCANPSRKRKVNKQHRRAIVRKENEKEGLGEVIDEGRDVCE